jgi:hypothetical protein
LKRYKEVLQRCSDVVRIPGAFFLLAIVPFVALAWFGPTAWSAVGVLSPNRAAMAPLAGPAAGPQYSNVFTDWTDTASVATPSASAEASRVSSQLNQQIAALKTLHDQQTSQVNQAILVIEMTSLQSNADTFSSSVLTSSGKASPGLTPYELAHARSAGMHQEILLYRQALTQLTNQAAATLLLQQLNLKYQEATALDHSYRSLTGRHATPTAIHNSLVALNTAINTASNNGLAAQQQEFSSGKLIPVNSSPFTFSSSTAP